MYLRAESVSVFNYIYSFYRHCCPKQCTNEPSRRSTSKLPHVPQGLQIYEVTYECITNDTLRQKERKIKGYRHITSLIKFLKTERDSAD